MPPWTCPECDRSFGRRNQSHMCEPVTSVDAWFADRPPEFRRIHDAVVKHLESLGKIEVDPVEVGILIKIGVRMFLEDHQEPILKVL